MMSHIPGVSDAARARELYKYFQPNSTSILAGTRLPSQDEALSDDPASFNELNVHSNVSSSKISSPDTALTAFSQLVSWRTGTQRAMISVIDADTQHFIAESSKTLDLIDNSRHGPGDDLWMGCGKVSKAGRLCERTIELPPAPVGEFTAFIISDLSKDDRFNQLPFVTGPPFVKFYAGTPLVTRRGIAIGSLFVVDNRVRSGLSKEEIHFMGTMAITIMRHMEMLREVEEHRRGMKMSRGLASFVEGRTQLVEAEPGAEDEEGATVAGQFEIMNATPKPPKNSAWSSRASSQNPLISSIKRKEMEYSTAMVKTEEAIMTSSRKVDASLQFDQRDGVSDSQLTSYDAISISSQADIAANKAESPASSGESEASALKTLFSRAANLIREAFEVDGGSVFYDAQQGFSGEYGQDAAEENTIHVDDCSSEDSRSTSDSTHAESKHVAKAQQERQTSFTSLTSSSGIFRRIPVDSKKAVEILGFSTPNASSVHGDEYPGRHSFIQFDKKSLHGFLRRYPRGKLWTFGQDGCISSSEEDNTIPLPSQTATIGQIKRKRARAAAEAAVLLRHFPGVRQLLFVPLWDAARSRWLSGNFTWSTEPTRILSKQGELAFLTAFGNSVMAECSRLDTEIADQKKGDFIGSISHELRSPLHGILASAEFLGEEVAKGFAKGLVETIDSCGRTLLDTINHILDFSKINHLEKNWRRSQRGGSSISQPGARNADSFALRTTDLPMINLFADVDISIVCEEVVESVFAGHVFQNVTAPSFDVVADSRGKMADPNIYIASSEPILDSEHPSHYPDVAVILDVDIQNYHFTTQPGAFRRIIMNLLGNALKYTSRGHVRIKLEATEMDDLQPAGSVESIPRAFVALTVTDTGKGISSNFIRSKLFTPFTQENPLSSGTGLGLSIVRSIVALLEGEIAVKSELGRGTEIKVTLPLLRELPKGAESSGSTPKSVSSLPKESEEVVDQLRSRVVGKTVSLVGFSNDMKDPIALQRNQLLKASITNFLSNWYGLRLVFDKEKADIVIVNEPNPSDISNLAGLRRAGRKYPAVLALCSHSSRFNRAYAGTEVNANFGFLAKPIGPVKLARAINQCLDGILATTTPGLERGPAAAGGTAAGTQDLSNIFEDLSLSRSPGGVELLDNSRMAVDSDNARKAIEPPTPIPGAEKRKDFPFPIHSEQPPAPTAKRIPIDNGSLTSVGSSVHDSRASVVLSKIENKATGSVTPVTAPSSAIHILPAPRLLLVDDNKINLRLLRTYLRRRQYPCVDEAENGLDAVNAVQNCVDGYDIIFMDISMPVLDGFGATRQIRQIERARKDNAARDGEPDPTPALIIALTGLASSRDQSEALTSGIDLFMTKPVAFKEVGKMLDNWEANREREVKSAGESGGIGSAGAGASTGARWNFLQKAPGMANEQAQSQREA